MLKRFENIKEIRKDKITVEFFYNECKDRINLEKITQKPFNLEKVITDKDIHRPGLALAGYTGLFTFNRIQIIGNTETRYLNQLSPEGKYESLKRLFSFNIPCIAVTNNNEVCEEMLQLADEFGITIF
ncbi:MAG TPA: hypothetical protein VEX17_04080, partial [Bacillales bacterium]|nr:hypothetical protein [Bacillales bacterium]